MRTTINNNRGTALVAALFFITALSLTATVIVWVTSSERRVSHNEYSHVRSFFSSDAGSETAIAWLRALQIPPVPTVEDGEQWVRREADYTMLQSDHEYRYDIKHKLDAGGSITLRHRPGWDNSWVDYEYVVDSFGNSVQQSQTRIEVQAARLFKQADDSYGN
jgi:Tfp pilus assembly protein PilX